MNQHVQLQRLLMLPASQDGRSRLSPFVQIQISASSRGIVLNLEGRLARINETERGLA
jgi:hypothetical protein